MIVLLEEMEIVGDEGVGSISGPYTTIHINACIYILRVRCYRHACVGCDFGI